MESLFTSGRVADVVLAVMAVEAIWLLARRSERSHGKRLADVVLALGPGVCLMAALRCALTGAGWPWVALWLAASFPLHLADLIRRRL